ncbi:pilus assembly protein [Pasteurella sp. P03HT]
MLLLDKESIAVDTVRKIVIVSRQESVQCNVAQTLRTRGLENVEIINTDFLSSSNLTFNAEEVVGVIVDIAHETDVKVISENVYSVVPQNVWCCVVGQSDSISLAQKLMDEGIPYFHSETQLNQMVAKIVSGVNIPFVRNTVKIAVLSCKGGSGASMISAHLANEIALHKKVPVLLAQGVNGSQDLELLFDRKLQGDVVPYMSNLELYSGLPSRLPASTTDKYNFIIYDQPIFNSHKEEYSKYLEYSNSCVLIVERTLASLRVAKQFLDECDRVRNATGKPIRTFICISDNSLEKSKLISTSDIETLLKCPVDVVIPFLKKTDAKTVLDVNLGRSGKKEIHSLMMKVVGAVSRQRRRSEKQSFLELLRKTIMGN